MAAGLSKSLHFQPVSSSAKRRQQDYQAASEDEPQWQYTTAQGRTALSSWKTDWETVSSSEQAASRASGRRLKERQGTRVQPRGETYW